ncbi:ferrous iron transport protein A [Oceanotoga sp. DSM 15011]|jgi:Fe2+ transport system protein FeoA|uniref:Ferrous iron transport protein A n=1 Tax=Oceanotoga teriensis TaxID=515440 RepID=A0AA45C7K4_9BACT|nr:MULTISPECIES: FeoA family protein [Oceanotoga]MDN5342163.1 ferrous iron transport protein [Oceanotoga sp.]MDO7976210.1 ferrous iron transport protein A [Oceanotoga teriensis]PWJ95407.1 ferrous iron transport protein A [Oceanotoga teriensis]UYP01046.1 ferrous iron transport protein A [Oceanotoga sp. DSM 15011]
MKEIYLHSLKPGQKCIIRSLNSSGIEGQRLLDMGFIRGTELKVVRNAPFADPIEILIRGCNISIRRDEASLIGVEII